MSEFENNIIHCLKWCPLELPSKNRPCLSSIFSLKSNDWFFKLIYKESQSEFDYSSFDLYLLLKTKRNNLISYYIDFQVGFKYQRILNLSKGRCDISLEKQKICSISESTLRENLPSDFIMGNRLKFQFYFHDVVVAETPLRNSKEDKSVQTGTFWNPDVSQEGLSKDFFMLMTSDSNHDMEIKCGEHTIKAHKMVICGRSEVFKAMLQSDMQEGRTGIVEIKDIDASHFQDFIKYLYTDNLPELTFEKAKALYEAGDKYAVRSLTLRCSEYLQDNLCLENFLQCLALADAHSDLKLKDRIVTYSFNEKMYLRKKYWMPVSDNFPKVANEVYRLSYEKDMMEDSE